MPHFDSRLRVTYITLPWISDDLYEYFEKITNIHPQITEAMLVRILRTNPDSNVEVFSTKVTTFASWTKNASPRNVAPCQNMYGLLQRHPHHETAWAIIAAKLISIARYSTKADSVFTEYSAQYLLDCYRPPKIVEAKKIRTCCTVGSVENGIEYALKMKIPRKIDWDYVGCGSNFEPPSHVTRFSVMGEICHLSFREALVSLKYQPIAAKLHLFTPEDKFAKDEIYVGPKHWNSTYMGPIDVMVYETKILEGKLVAVVKCPCAEVECLNVSLDVELVKLWNNNPVRADVPCTTKGLEEPTRLLTKFLAISRR